MKRFLPAIILASMIVLSACGVSTAKERFNEASTYLEEHKFDEAEAVFLELIDENKYIPESYRGVGVARFFSGMYPEADTAFSRALLNADENDYEFKRDVNEYIAYCRMKQGKSDEAKAIYDALIEENAEADILYLRGRIFMSEGNVTEAANDFAHAVRISNDYNLYISIYELYKDYNMNADGADFLKEALAMAEREESNNYGSGVVHYYLENYDDAKDALIKALKENNSDSRAVLLLGKTYLALDDAANARAMYKEHLDDPSCAAAIVYEHKQDWTTARMKAISFAAQYPTNEAGQREAAFLSTR